MAGKWTEIARGEAPPSVETSAPSPDAPDAEAKPISEPAKAEAGEPKEGGEAKPHDTGEPRRSADVRPRFEVRKRELREGGVDNREAGRQAARETIGSLPAAMEAQARAQEQAWRSHEKIVDGLLGRLKDESDKRNAEVAALRAEIDVLRAEMRALTEGAKAKVEALQAAVEPAAGAAVAPAAEASAPAEGASTGVTEKDLDGMSVQELGALIVSTTEVLKRAMPDQQDLMRRQIAKLSVLKARKLQPEFAAKAEVAKKKQEEEARQKEEEAARETERRKQRDPVGVMRELQRARDFLFAAQSLERTYQVTPQAPELAKVRQAIRAAQAIVNARADLWQHLTGKAVDYAELNAKSDQRGVETARKELVGRGLEIPAIREYGPLDVLRQVVRLREIASAADALTKSGAVEHVGLGFTAREAAQRELSAAMAEYQRQTGVELTYAYLNELLERDPKKLEASTRRSRELAERLARATRLDAFVTASEAATDAWKKMRAAGGKDKAPELHLAWRKATDAVKQAEAKLSPDQLELTSKWKSGPASAELSQAVYKFVTGLKEDLLTNGFEISTLPEVPATKVVVEEEPEQVGKVEEQVVEVAAGQEGVEDARLAA